MIAIKPVICKQCGLRIEMDSLGFPLCDVLMCRNLDGSTFMIHLHCYTEDLELA